MVQGIGPSAGFSQSVQAQKPAGTPENTAKSQDTQNVQESRPASVLSIELTEDEEKIVRELRDRDQEVRAHENAHKSAGGGIVGAISYETVTGPDGREYAVAGEAQIDSSPVSGNPAATIRKMDQVIRAALAPAQPSSQDYAVARAAQAARFQAQQELNKTREAENTGEEESGPFENVESARSAEEGQNIIKAIENLVSASFLGS